MTRSSPEEYFAALFGPLNFRADLPSNNREQPLTTAPKFPAAASAFPQFYSSRDVVSGEPTKDAELPAGGRQHITSRGLLFLDDPLLFNPPKDPKPHEMKNDRKWIPQGAGLNTRSHIIMASVVNTLNNIPRNDIPTMNLAIDHRVPNYTTLARIAALQDATDNLPTSSPGFDQWLALFRVRLKVQQAALTCAATMGLDISKVSITIRYLAEEPRAERSVNYHQIPKYEPICRRIVRLAETLENPTASEYHYNRWLQHIRAEFFMIAMSVVNDPDNIPYKDWMFWQAVFMFHTRSLQGISIYPAYLSEQLKKEGLVSVCRIRKEVARRVRAPPGLPYPPASRLLQGGLPEVPAVDEATSKEAAQDESISRGWSRYTAAREMGETGDQFDKIISCGNDWYMD